MTRGGNYLQTWMCVIEVCVFAAQIQMHVEGIAVHCLKRFACCAQVDLQGYTTTLSCAGFANIT